ncbi:MAG: DUF1464 family protein [Candidatus Bathyarchaeia archaeon]
MGIDPGTKSFDVCGMDDGKVFLDKSLSTREVSRRPEVLTQTLKLAGPLDCIVGPSGYGLPPKIIAQLTGAEERLTRLVRPDDEEMKKRSPIALGKVIKHLRATTLPVYLIPGVKHLPTVPPHRKVNRIDMGTPDKVCSVALAIHDEARRLGVQYSETSFILVEVGWGFTAVLGVEHGTIVDGIGGAEGAMGFQSFGGLDAEVAYLLGGFSKRTLYKGGVVSVAGLKRPSVNKLVKGLASHERCRWAWDAWLEATAKDVAAIALSTPHAREVLLSGRMKRNPHVSRELTKKLAQFGTVTVVQGFATHAKEAAQGACLLANGFVGGKYKPLLDILQLKKAENVLLDYIYVDELKSRVRRN